MGPTLKIFFAHQTNKDTSKLNNIRISNRVETSDPGVHDSDQGTQDDGCINLHVDDYGQSGTCEKKR